jgi:hypothetical protein
MMTQVSVAAAITSDFVLRNVEVINSCSNAHRRRNIIFVDDKTKMSRRWLIQAKDFPTAPGVWGDSATIDLTTLLPSPNITAIRVRKAMIPMLIWNVTSDNQTARLTVGGPTYTVTLTPGYYSGSSLATALANALNTALGATTFSVSIVTNPSSYLTTITVTDSAIPGPAPFTLDTISLATLSPSILTMFGFGTDPLVSLTGVETSTGALNVVTDRFLLITCDEARGNMGIIDSLNPSAWHKGIICVVPIKVAVNPGDVICYTPEADSPWINLVRPSTNNAFTLRLSRNDYPTMGGQQTNWAIELEVRV